MDDDDDESSVESDDEVPPLQEGATRTESGVVRDKQRAITMQNAEHFTQRVRHHEEREKSASIFGGTPGMATFLGARADASELLVAKHGWLDKQRPSWLNTWQRRWFVLCNKQLQWYNDPEDTAPLGVVDFAMCSASWVSAYPTTNALLQATLKHQLWPQGRWPSREFLQILKPTSPVLRDVLPFV